MGKLCLPNVMRGRLCWRDGDWETSARLLGSAHTVAERVGCRRSRSARCSRWLEPCATAASWTQAEATLGEALALCDRAGLVPQSVHAFAALALVEALAGRPELARTRPSAPRAPRRESTTPRARQPRSRPRRWSPSFPKALEGLRAAHAEWERLGRPLDVARCEMLIGPSHARAGRQRRRRGPDRRGRPVRADRYRPPRRQGARARRRMNGLVRPLRAPQADWAGCHALVPPSTTSSEPVT